jgi:hypothetical protein
MNQETEKKPLQGTLKLRRNNNLALSESDKETSNVDNQLHQPIVKDDTIELPTLLETETGNKNKTEAAKSKTKTEIEPKAVPSFTSIYKRLHKQFPEVINMEKPVLLALGIRKEMSQKTGISITILKRWIAWYCYKSNYYSLHKLGAVRFNLDGSEAGRVTENHQENIDKKLEKKNARRLLQQAETLGEQENASANSAKIE